VFPDAEFQGGIQRLLRLQRLAGLVLERQPDLAGLVTVDERSATHLMISVPAGRVVLAYERAGPIVNWIIVDPTDLEHPSRWPLETDDHALVDALTERVDSAISSREAKDS